MRKGKKLSKKKNNFYLYFSLMFLFLTTIIVSWPTVQTKLLSYAQVASSGGIQFTSELPKDNLQLYWFKVPTQPPSPPPGISVPVSGSPSRLPLCALDDDNGINVPTTCQCMDLVITCKNGVAYNDDGTVFEITAPNVDYAGPQEHLQTLCKGSVIAPTDGRYCIAKPVVYLYPEAPTLVDVRVESEGEIVVSDPLYPENGWKNVLAHPDGTLFYQGKQYSELFFETEVNDIKKPEKGIIIKTAQLEEKLDGIVDQLGLIDHEKREFLEFWVPRLKALKSPYIFFSVLDKAEKERLDKVIISPNPDTVIEFIAYFKPIETLDYDNSLQLPPKPKRVGFVSVEWGGSLDTH
jgi:hypothetical protein